MAQAKNKAQSRKVVPSLLILLAVLALCILPVYQEEIEIPPEIVRDFWNKRSKLPVEIPIFGLKSVKADKSQDLPLKKIYYKVSIKNSLAEVEFLQQYTNNLGRNIETEYFFAINSKSAFVSLQAIMDNRVIQGQIKDKAKAKEEYNEAIKQGKTAVMGEIVEELHDIMKLNLGNLQADKSVTIVIKYVEQLDVALNKFWRFSIGNTFSSRSLSDPSPSENLLKACNPAQLSKLSKDAYPWYITVEIQSPSRITFLKSPSHPITVRYQDDHSAVIELDVTQQFFPNKEFVLLYQNEEIHKPQVTLGMDKSDSEIPYAAQVTFFPDFNIEETEDTYAKFAKDYNYEFPYNENNLRGEYIFIIDRSGSIMGDRIQMTKQVLNQFIQMLPNDSYFNVISFGSDYKPMFNSSQQKTERVVADAIGQVQLFDSDMGGTNIYSPLKFALGIRPIEHYPRNIVLLTDGQVENEFSCVQVIKSQEKQYNFKLYSIGIGNGVSKSFITNMAEEGRGKYLFVEDLQQMKEKLQYILRDSLTPFLENVHVQLEQKYVKAISPLPESIKVVRKNEPFTIYVFFGADLQDTKILFSCYDSISKQVKSYDLELKLSQAQETDIIHKIGIHKMIKSMLSNAYYQNHPLDDIFFYQKTNYFERIKQLSIQHQVLSEFTAFILVDADSDDQNKSNRTQENPTKIEIPVIQSEDYDPASSNYGIMSNLQKDVGGNMYKGQTPGGAPPKNKPKMDRKKREAVSEAVSDGKSRQPNTPDDDDEKSSNYHDSTLETGTQQEREEQKELDQTATIRVNQLIIVFGVLALIVFIMRALQQRKKNRLEPTAPTQHSEELQLERMAYSGELQHQATHPEQQE